jgi:outer membrane lipoprotein-sorting protein
LYYPDDALIEVYPVESGFRDLAGVPMPQLHLLRKRFDIAPMKVHDMDPTADPDRFLAIALTPKAEDLRDHVTSIKMMIDQFRSVATKVFITGPDGDRTEISFSNIQLNTGMDPARVDLSTPEGTRRVSPLGEADPHSAQGAVQ